MRGASATAQAEWQWLQPVGPGAGVWIDHKDQEILDKTYTTYKKLTEKKPYPTLNGIEFQFNDVAQRNSKAKGAKPENFVNLAAMKDIDRSGFIDGLYKR
ncbi:MAG TPA: hypothetical protein VNT76_07190 [Candidatus Binatus sp.]|nr:hypothetical protein [Candidatus Binatus sp.]